MASKVISAKGSKNDHLFTLTVDETATSIEDNSSTVAISFTLSKDYYVNWSGYPLIKYTVNVGDNSYSGTIPKYGSGYTSNPLVLVNQTVTINHDNDGTKELALSFSVTDPYSDWYTCGNASGSGTFALTELPRASAIEVAPNDVISKGSELTIKGFRRIPTATDTLVVSCNGYNAVSKTFSLDEWSTSVTYDSIVSACHLDSNRTYDLTATVTTKVGTNVIGSNSVELKISTGTMPLSVYYENGEYGLSFGQKAYEVNKLKSYYSLEIGDSSTDLTLLLNGEEVGGSINITSNEDQIVGKYNGKDLYLRIMRWSSGQVVATGTQIGSLGKVDEVVQLNFTMTPSNKSNFWAGSVRDGSYYHQGVQVERSTGNVKVYYQDGWGSGTLVTVWVMYTKG